MGMVDGWDWVLKDDRTTTSAGYFQFENALQRDLGFQPAVLEIGDESGEYRLRIYVEESGNTKTYDLRGIWDVADWKANFHVATIGGGSELDINSGVWCDPEGTVTGATGDVLGLTDSTGGYQIKDMLDVSHFMWFAKAGFFGGLDEATVECGKETQLNYELICSNLLTAVVTDTDNNLVPGATVEATVTFDVNYGAGTDIKTDSGVTNNAGVATFNIAGAGTIVGTASAPGHDFLACVDPAETNCLTNPAIMRCGLCKWNTVVGTVTIGGQLAAGYKLDLIDMGVNPPAVVDTDTTTAAGVFSLENLSSDGKVGRDYRINLSNTGGTFISTTGDFTVDDCGETSVFTYTNGLWTDDGTW